MMKRKLLLLTLVVLLLSTLLVACGGDKEIINIKILEGMPYEVTVGTTPDFSNVKAGIEYNDQTIKEVTASELTFSTIDTSKTGKQELTITYEGFSIKVTITVKAPQVTLSTIEIISSSVADEVLVGGTHDTTGIQVLATYSDGTTKTLAAADVTITGIDTATAGEKTLTVAYGGKTATMTVTVAGVSKIRAEGVPPTVEEETELDLSNLKVFAVYSNGHEVLLEASAFTTEVTNVTENGKPAKKLTITYGEFVEEIVVSSVPPTLDRIEINAASYAKKIVIGETYETTGITATAYYSNGTSGTIANASLTIVAPDTATAGEKTLKVTYEGKEATAPVTVLGVTSVTIQSNTVNSGNLSVIVGDTVNLDNVAAKVKYSDNTIATITAANGLQVGTVSTDAPGKVTLTVTYKGVSGTIDIMVDETYSVFSVEYSDELAAFLGQSFSINYQDRGMNYKVGDDNPFLFNLKLTVVEDGESDTITDYVSSSKIYLVTGAGEQLLEGAELAAYVAINEQENTFDFTDAAVGNTFRIATRPAYGVDESDLDSITKSLTVDVVDAYNIYSAKELNIITNANSKDLLEFGKTNGKTQLDLCNDFLAQHNITRPANLRGVVLHSNLPVTVDDIPAKYLYDYTNKAGQQIGEFYDHFSLFYHELDSTNKTFGIYGNYFQISTATLPCVAEPGNAGNYETDPSSSSEVFYFAVKRSEYTVDRLGSFNHTNYQTRVENLFMIGDDPNSNNEKESGKDMRGLIAFKMSLQKVDFYNVIVQKHIVSIIPESDNLDVTVDKCYFYNAWSTHIFAWSENKVLEDLDKENETSAAAGFVNYKPLTLTIKDSTVAKCGGPAIASQIPEYNLPHNAQSGAIITAENSEIYSEVTGQEAWFVAYQFVELATQLKTLNQPISGYAQLYSQIASFIKDSSGEAKGEFVNLIYVNQGPRGSFTVVGSASINPNEQNAATQIAATGGMAPVLQSSAGGLGYIYQNPDNPLDVAIRKGGLTEFTGPDVSIFQGNYLNVFFKGMSIFVSYYH